MGRWLCADRGLVIALGGALLWRLTHTPRRRLLATVKAISADYLHDIVIPDGLDGHIHLDLVLLTTRGILVLDIKDHRGSVFAGANMEQWTVMDGPRRISVRNPLGALHDRVHAVRQLVQNEVPVEGRAVFTSDASFVKGRPEGVVLLAELRDDFRHAQRRRRAQRRSISFPLAAHTRSLRAGVRPARHSRLDAPR